MSAEPSSATPIQMTLTFEFSREGLHELKRRVDELLGGVPGSTEPASQRDASQSRRKVTLLWGRLAETSRAYLVACSRVESEFTIEDIAHAMGEPPTRVQAFHRN